jgi:predicted acylesterase/phospholipase RssA
VLLGADSRTDALILSGGGAKGAYEIGVMKALFEGASPATGFRPLEVEVYTGTSVGAYNASYMVSRNAVTSLEALLELERIWRQRVANTLTSCGNGVYRLRSAPLQLGDFGCLLHPFQEATELTSDALFWARYALTRGADFLTSDAPLRTRVLDSFDFSALIDPGPLYELVEETVDLAGLRVSSRALTLIATNWTYGTVAHFNRLEVAGPVGVQAILGSAAIPGLFPPVPIGGALFVDGGVLMNTPLDPAIRNGADVLHVIYLDPHVCDIPFPRYPNTLDTIYRFWAVEQSDAFREDIHTVAKINDELEYLDRLSPGAATRALASHLLPFSRVLQRQSEGRDSRPLTVHSYRPRTDFGGAEGLIDFREDRIDFMIKSGYADAVQHDCRAAGCVLPRRAPAEPVESAFASASRGG